MTLTEDTTYSYGGTVITNAARDNVKALVYVAGFAPEEGETALELAARFPGATFGDTLRTVPLPDGSTDLYIRQEEYRQPFAGDVPAEQTALMAMGQRPVRDAAANEASGPPAWKSIPSWFVFGDLEHPGGGPPLHGRARRGPRGRGDRGDIPRGVVSHPEEVADVIPPGARGRRVRS